MGLEETMSGVLRTPVADRREFLRRAGLAALYGAVIGSVSCSCSSALAQKTARLPQMRGCLVQGDAMAAFAEQTSHSWMSYSQLIQLFETSGDPNLDRAFGVMLAHLGSLFEVNPRFFFYDDGGAPNAIATSEVHDPNYRHGTVFMGTTLMSEFLQRSQFGDILVMAVCAHEFGHIVQYNTGDLIDRLDRMHHSVKYVELHADFLAGFYIGRRSSSYEVEQLRTLGAGYEAMGDTAYNDPSHHGTHAERIAAVEAGYQMALNTDGDIDEAIAAGLDHLHS